MDQEKSSVIGKEGKFKAAEYQDKRLSELKSKGVPRPKLCRVTEDVKVRYCLQRGRRTNSSWSSAALCFPTEVAMVSGIQFSSTRGKCQVVPALWVDST